MKGNGLQHIISMGEIDFILNKKMAFEVKVKGDSSDFKRLKRIAGSLKLKESYLVVREYSDVAKTILAQDL